MLNWNGDEDTIECLESLRDVDYSNFDVYLVDNFSKKESISNIEEYLQGSDYSFDLLHKRELDTYVKSDDVDLVFILNDENSGFAGGNNVALDYLLKNHVSDYILLLNNDTIVSKDFIRGMLSKAYESDETGFVGINTYYYDNRSVLQTVGGGTVDFVHGEAMAVTNDNVDDFDFITGSCILMSYDVLSKIGLMNTDYFMYWEDVDWSRVACENGYTLEISDYGYVCHKEGASIQSLRRIYYHTRNRIWFMKRHTSTLNYYKFIIYILLFVLKESTLNIISNRKYSKTLLKGLFDALLKRNKGK